MEVIEFGLLVVVVAAVAERVNFCQSSGCGEDIAPGVVGVLGGGLVGDRVVDAVESSVAGVGEHRPANRVVYMTAIDNESILKRSTN